MCANRRNRGELVVAILNLAKQMGRITRADVESRLGIENNTCGAMMSRLSTKGPRSGKRLYVVDWRNDFPGERNYPRAIYALCITGEERDAPKEKTLKRKRAIVAMSSVFAWGDSLKKPRRGAKVKAKPTKRERNFTKNELT